MYAVFASERYRTHRGLREVVAQLQFRVFQEPREHLAAVLRLADLPIRRLPERTPAARVAVDSEMQTTVVVGDITISLDDSRCDISCQIQCPLGK